VSEQEREQEADSGAWLDDFGPMHEVWIRFERGMQILLGVALITMFGFLGESWGGENIPYQNIMKAVYRVSWAFAIAIMSPPIILGLGLIARRYLPYSRRTRGRAYLVALLIMLAYCWSMLYVSVVDVIESLVTATGIEKPYP
jgi:hypothetical protein